RAHGRSAARGLAGETSVPALSWTEPGVLRIREFGGRLVWHARSMVLACFALSLLTPLFVCQTAAPRCAAAGETIRLSGSSWPPSSSSTTPLHSWLQPWSG